MGVEDLVGFFNFLGPKPLGFGLKAAQRKVEFGHG